jgi:hypothetical protein
MECGDMLPLWVSNGARVAAALVRVTRLKIQSGDESPHSKIVSATHALRNTALYSCRWESS